MLMPPSPGPFDEPRGPSRSRNDVGASRTAPGPIDPVNDHCTTGAVRSPLTNIKFLRTRRSPDPPSSRLCRRRDGRSCGQFDTHHVFRHLVAKLALDAQPDWGAVRDRESLVVHLVGQNGLRMHRLVQIDTLIVFCVWIAVLHRIGTVKHRVSRRWLRLGLLHHLGQGHALPFADATPALDAVMAGDLGARWHGPQIAEREFRGVPHEAVHLQPPIGKAVRRQFLVVVVIRIGRAVALEVGREIGLGVFGGQRLRAADQPLDDAVSAASALPSIRCTVGSSDSRSQPPRSEVPSVPVAPATERSAIDAKLVTRLHVLRPRSRSARSTWSADCSKPRRRLP